MQGVLKTCDLHVDQLQVEWAAILVLISTGPIVAPEQSMYA